jgi:hypothetical protein
MVGSDRMVRRAPTQGTHTMSKIGNHRVEVQESVAYQWGWEVAERGYGLIRGYTNAPISQKVIETGWQAARQGWQDYHDQEKNDGQ